MFTLLNSNSTSPIILLCEHAENKIPEALGNLGLSDPSILEYHHLWDRPTKPITLGLAKKLGCTALLGNYARIVVDLNRAENIGSTASDLIDVLPNFNHIIPEVYFDLDIPGNQGLTEAETKARLNTYYFPFHKEVANQINRIQKMGKTPFIFSIHSFTENPGLQIPKRPWDIGLLYDQYEDAAHLFSDFIEKNNPEMNVGHNQPYNLKEIKLGGVIQHGQNNHLPYLLVELKNEAFLRGDHTTEMWVDIFASILTSPEFEKLLS